MLEILEILIAMLTKDTALTAIVPASNILVGPVDITTEAQNSLVLPQINIHIISEVSRTVPLNTRDTMIQIDIWDRNNMLETVQISEMIIALLNYTSPTEDTAKVFWQRLGGTTDQYESNRRIWHRSLTYQAWSILGQ